MMDPLIPHMRNVFLFAFLLCLSNFTQASEQTSPESIVYNFYKSYLKEESSDNSRFVSQYVSDELMKSINDSMMCNYDSDDSVSAEELEENVHKSANASSLKGVIFVTVMVLGLILMLIILQNHKMFILHGKQA
ncbi:TPA: hypothetical protein ACYFH0_003280 [Klebsiella pneumoniae]|nr:MULTISPECIES: hypothetical protein [Klebsiella]MCA5546949.1 hypothetical protein [Klebsiella pneumoniae]MCA6702345.1 hypothetical protein [Klebsiella pneumoniae]MCC5690127.1 hypothetical protein [Klebsiella pneumoniae]MCD5633625.1 hypothetical protein [Klebsiella pneumoniae]MCD5634705.1 hypothetical protein [Klebsiella pneumoniae]